MDCVSSRLVTITSIPSKPVSEASRKISSSSKLYSEAVEMMNSTIMHHPLDQSTARSLPQNAANQRRSRVVSGQHASISGGAGTQGLLDGTQALIRSFQHPLCLLGQAAYFVQLAVDVLHGMIEVGEQEVHLRAGVI